MIIAMQPLTNKVISLAIVVILEVYLFLALMGKKYDGHA